MMIGNLDDGDDDVVSLLDEACGLDDFECSGSFSEDEAEEAGPLWEADDEEEDAIEFLLPDRTAKEISQHPCPQLTESLISKQMAKLSTRDREEVYFDIHGVSGSVNEEAEPGFLDKKLAEMEYELETIDDAEKEAYTKAYKTNPRYVLDKNLRLRFLRADRFDAKMAAQRYVNHYEVKLELFGAETLGRDIVQDDLDEESLDALYCPYHQLLPQRDRAGRALFLYVANPQHRSYSGQALLRRGFYFAMLITDDVETQREGVVPIYYALDSTSGGGGSGFVNKVWKMGQMFKSIPWRVAGIHFCYSNLTWLPAMSTMRLAADLCLRMRFRAHRGSHSECMYNLQTFGIPTHVIPIDDNGQFSSEKYRKVLTNRRNQENQWEKTLEQQAIESSSETGADKTPSSASMISPRDRITVPSSYDVLLGRGKGYFNHIGNIRYRSLIEDCRLRYERSRKDVKKCITEEVVERIHQSGGRFLKDNGSGSWILVEGEAARLKVSHSFRALRPATLKQQQQQQARKPKTTATSKNKATMITTSGVRQEPQPPRSKRTRAS